jgi:hypothetical protein
MCETDDACNALMPEGERGICYKQGIVVKDMHQTCHQQEDRRHAQGEETTGHFRLYSREQGMQLSM